MCSVRCFLCLTRSLLRDVDNHTGESNSITGASRGFGRICAEAALKRGDKVAATARNLAGLSDLADRFGESVLPLTLDCDRPKASTRCRCSSARSFRQLGCFRHIRHRQESTNNGRNLSIRSTSTGPSFRMHLSLRSREPAWKVAPSMLIANRRSGTAKLAMEIGRSPSGGATGTGAGAKSSTPRTGARIGVRDGSQRPPSARRDKDQIALLRYEESAASPFSLCWLGALIRPSNLVERTHADIVVVG